MQIVLLALTAIKSGMDRVRLEKEIYKSYNGKLFIWEHIWEKGPIDN